MISMKKWGFMILAMVALLFFVSGCAKKEILKEDTSQKEAAAVAKEKSDAPKQLADEDAAKKRAAKEKADRETAARDNADREAALKAQKEKDAAKKRAEAETKAIAKELYELVDINFDFDKANLSDNARAILDKHAVWLNKNKAANITIEGNCDERGTAEYNLALGQRRAESAAKYLMDMGIDSKRIRTISYGLERPLDPAHNEAAWAKNRRDHFVVSEK
jgi:peptidoglycan-associated lipoprotein